MHLCLVVWASMPYMHAESCVAKEDIRSPPSEITGSYKLFVGSGNWTLGLLMFSQWFYSQLPLQPQNVFIYNIFWHFFLLQLLPDSPPPRQLDVCVHARPSCTLCLSFWDPSLLMTKSSLVLKLSFQKKRERERKVFVKSLQVTLVTVPHLEGKKSFMHPLLCFLL